MQTLIAYGAAACAFGYGVLLFIRSMRRPDRDRPTPGCGACGRCRRHGKDAYHGER